MTTITVVLTSSTVFMATALALTRKTSVHSAFSMRYMEQKYSSPSKTALEYTIPLASSSSRAASKDVPWRYSIPSSAL